MPRKIKLVGWNPSLQEYEPCKGGDCGWHIEHQPATLSEVIQAGIVSSRECPTCLILTDEPHKHEEYPLE
jgi:hypothetical protein